MNSDCSFYVLICLCIGGLPMTAFRVQGDQTQRKIKWSTDRGLYFCSFNFFFYFKTVFFFFFFLSLVMVTGRGRPTSALPCKEKEILCLLFVVFVFYSLHFNCASQCAIVCFQSFIVQLSYVSAECVVSVQRTTAATWRYRISHRRGPTFYCMQTLHSRW